MKPIYKLRDWIDVNDLFWNTLPLNPYKTYWPELSRDTPVIHLAENQVVDWEQLSANPGAIHILEKNKEKIDWIALSENPAIMTYDYNAMNKNMKNSGLAEELIQKVWKPERLIKLSEVYEIGFDELMELLD